MCGIAGYTGHRQAYPILLDALLHVEYRGYDSCGIAISTGNDIALFKEALLAVDPASSGALASLNSVPEPSSLLLLSLGLIGLLTSRRRRMR